MPQKPQSFIDERMARILKDNGRYETMTLAQRCRFIKRVKEVLCQTTDTKNIRTLTNILKDIGEPDQSKAPTFTNVQSLCLYWRHNQKELTDADIDDIESQVTCMLNELESIDGFKDMANITRLKRTLRSINGYKRALAYYQIRQRLDTSPETA